jgi:hypothetical protein
MPSTSSRYIIAQWKRLGNPASKMASVVMAEIMQIGRNFQGHYVWRGNVKVYFLFIEEEYEGSSFTFYIFYAQKFNNICAYLKILILNYLN